ncbi:hypothetical protein V1951_18010 [Yersinia sp. 2544 StPb PI]|uniref:hypothetical protein n=1 Tax=unclassified Yersinia (in: enterobacteria) TaxID=2653513 RepID=UPI00187D478A
MSDFIRGFRPDLILVAIAAAQRPFSLSRIRRCSASATAANIWWPTVQAPID